MPAPNREQLYKSTLIATIRKYAFTYGYNMGQVAERAGMTESTLYSRMRNPGKLSLDEVNRIAKAIRIPVNELAPILTWSGDR